MQHYSTARSSLKEQEEVPLLTHSTSLDMQLDLSHLGQSTDEKLPAIIITPCIPSSPLDYEIAFLASKKDEYTIDERSSWVFFGQPTPSLFDLTRKSSRRARAAFCIALPVAVVGIHFMITRMMSEWEEGRRGWSSPF